MYVTQDVPKKLLSNHYRFMSFLFGLCHNKNGRDVQKKVVINVEMSSLRMRSCT